MVNSIYRINTQRDDFLFFLPRVYNLFMTKNHTCYCGLVPGPHVEE